MIEVNISNFPLEVTVQTNSGPVVVSLTQNSPIVAVSTIGIQGPPGPEGPEGPPGPGGVVTSKVAASEIVAGQPVRPNAGGYLVLAQADSTNNAKGVRLAVTSASPSFAVTLGQNFLTLSDWSVATGFLELVPNTDYFLDSVIPGFLVSIVPEIGVVLHIGTALDTSTMALSGADPITL